MRESTTRSTTGGLARIGLSAALALLAGLAQAGTETYAFDGRIETLHVKGALTVEYAEQAAPRTEVRVESAGDREGDVAVGFEAGTLTVSNVRGLTAAANLVVRVRGAGLQRLRTDGATNVRLDGLRADRFELTAQGASDVRVAGQAHSASFVVRGAGNVDAGGLPVERASVDFDGAGTVDVHATDALDVRLRGVGRVTYAGTPKVSRDIGGLGSVAPRR